MDMLLVIAFHKVQKGILQFLNSKECPESCNIWLFCFGSFIIT
jgi:hypothetical protein